MVLGSVRSNKDDIWDRLPSRRLQQSFSYYAPYANPADSYTRFGGYQNGVRSTVQTHQPRTTSGVPVNTLSQSNGFINGGQGLLLPTTTPPFVPVTNTQNSASAAVNPFAAPIPSLNVPSNPIGYPPGLHELAAAPLKQQVLAAKAYKKNFKNEKSAQALEGLRYLDNLKKGFKQKRRFFREGFLTELNRSPGNDLGQLSLQQATNYAYQRGDDIVNVASNSGVQRVLGPSPSTLTPDQVFQSGFQQGLNQGVLSGAQTGFDAGFAGGFMQGFENGVQQRTNQQLPPGAEGAPSDSADPSYQEGYQEGIQVGLNQGYLAGLELREQLAAQEIGQDDMMRLGEEALSEFLKDLLEDDDIQEEDPVGEPFVPIPKSQIEPKKTANVMVERARNEDGDQVEKDNEAPRDPMGKTNSSELQETFSNEDVSTGLEEATTLDFTLTISSQNPNETVDFFHGVNATELVNDFLDDPEKSEALNQLVLEALRLSSVSGNTDLEIELEEVKIGNMTEESQAQIIRSTADALHRAGHWVGPFSVTQLSPGNASDMANLLSLDKDLIAEIETILEEDTKIDDGEERGEGIEVVLDRKPGEASPIFSSRLLSNRNDSEEPPKTIFEDQRNEDDAEGVEIASGRGLDAKRVPIWVLIATGGVIGSMAFIGMFCCLRHRRAKHLKENGGSSM